MYNKYCILSKRKGKFQQFSVKQIHIENQHLTEMSKK